MSDSPTVDSDSTLTLGKEDVLTFRSVRIFYPQKMPCVERHWLVAIFLQLAIRVRYLFESRFGLIPLFSPTTAYPSPFRPKNCPQYDFVTQTGFLWIWFTAAITRDYAILYVICRYTGILYLMNALHSWLSNRLIAQFNEKGYTNAEREMKIPEYDWKKGNPEEFYETFVRRPHPVILRGFMKDSELLQELSWKTVMQRYGQEEVFLTTKEKDGFPGKLEEVNNPKVYLHNSEKLFNKYPAIRDLFQYEKLEPYCHLKAGYEQIFVGRQGTGTPFHHAAVYNWFYQIDGQKHWWFIDPYDSFLAYPLALLGRAAGFSFCLFPNDFNPAAFPLFAFCPVYSAVLQPGDVLFNPPWWWHAVQNVSETTVAVASRWHTDGICGHQFVMTEEDYSIYRPGSFFFMLGLHSWSFLHSILQTPSPRYDEHLTLREINNRFVDRQHRMAQDGGLNFQGCVTKF